MKQISRFKELTCVLFGHQWNQHGSTRNDRGFILEEYTECSHCWLRNHDGSGYKIEAKKTPEQIAKEYQYLIAKGKIEGKL
jgi:hypothetical protein